MKKSFAEVVVPLKSSVARRRGEEVLEVVEDVERPSDAHGDAVHVPLELQLAAVVATTPGNRGPHRSDFFAFLDVSTCVMCVHVMYPSRSTCSKYCMRPCTRT